MANIKTTFDEKSLVIANVLNAGETITYDWSVDELYQIVLTKGTVTIGSTSYDAISVIDIQPNTNLSVSASSESSFLTLFRSDNQSLIDQIMPGDGTQSSYYEFMRNYKSSWYDAGVPEAAPDSIDVLTGNKTVTSQDIKTMVLQGWT